MGHRRPEVHRQDFRDGEFPRIESRGHTRANQRQFQLFVGVGVEETGARVFVQVEARTRQSLTVEYGIHRVAFLRGASRREPDDWFIAAAKS